MPAISRIWAGSALISAGLQPQQGNLEPGRLVSAIGLLIPQCRPGRTTKTPRLQGNLSRRSRSYGHSMGVNTPARKSALGAEPAPRRGSSSSSSPQIVFSRGPAAPERHSGACASPTKTSSLRGDHCQVTVGLARHHGQFGYPAAVSGMNQAQLQALVDEATVDAYDRDEQVMGLNTMIEDILAVPFETTVLGSL